VKKKKEGFRIGTYIMALSYYIMTADWDLV